VDYRWIFFVLSESPRKFFRNRPGKKFRPGLSTRVRVLLSVSAETTLAPKAGDVATVQILLERGAMADAMKDGRSVLDLAAEGGNVEVVYHILGRTSAGASAALIRAVDNGDLGIVKQLLYSPGVGSSEKTTALNLAIANGHEAIASTLNDFGAVLLQLPRINEDQEKAVREGNIPELKRLLRGSDVIRKHLGYLAELLYTYGSQLRALQGCRRAD